MDDLDLKALSAIRFAARTHLTLNQMGQLMVPNDLPDPIQDCFVAHRDPARVAPIMSEVFVEIAKRQALGHFLQGGSFEAEVVWLSGNFDTVNRKVLIETIATLIEQVAMIKPYLNPNSPPSKTA